VSVAVLSKLPRVVLLHSHVHLYILPLTSLPAIVMTKLNMAYCKKIYLGTGVMLTWRMFMSRGRPKQLIDDC